MTSNYFVKSFNRGQTPLRSFFLVFLVMAGAISR